MVGPRMPTTTGGALSKEVFIGTKSPSEAIRKNGKRSITFKEKNDHGGLQLVKPDHEVKDPDNHVQSILKYRNT